MTRPRPILLWMVFFVVVVALGCSLLAAPLNQAFSSNTWFNSVILAILGVGILINFRQVASLYPEIDWIESYQRGETSNGDEFHPRLLSSMAHMLGGHATTTLSATSTRTMLDSIRTRLEESRDLSRYLIGLLIFLGLLGTFWGLMATVGSVSAVVSDLAVDGSDATALFESLKQNLEQPLSGMGVAFSSSLFGLAGSLVLGFLDLQAAHAQNRFVNELEEWLASSTRLSSGLLGDEGIGGAPAYVQALLEKTADTLEKMQRTGGADEVQRERMNSRLADLGDTLARFNRQLDAQNDRLERLAATHSEIPRLLERLAERDSGAEFSEQLREELRLLNRTIANALTERKP